MNTQANYFKKALIMLMAVMMVFTMMPGMAWAADGADTGSSENVTSNIVDSGTCGSDEVTYTLYSDGRLVIRGTGSIEKGTWENSIKTKVKEISIDGNITTIGKMVFMSYSNLRSVNLGSITSIDMAAFNGCTNLETIQADSVTKIGSQVFNNCKKIKTISLKALTDSKNIPITNSLESLTIGKNTNSKFISNLVKASSLKELNIPEENNFLKVENSLLLSKDGTKLYYTLRNGEMNITIPDTVTSIEKNAFANYSELTHVSVLNGLQTIGASAFKDCTGLTEMPIPTGVTTIDSTAFSGCSNLKAFTMNGEGETYRVQNGILLSDGGKAVFMVPPQFSGVFVVPSSVEAIGANAFKNCTGLSGITFTGGLFTIGANAFDGCVGLQTVEIPTSVTTIGSSAFANCKNLEVVTLPQNLTNIAQSTFMNCTALKTIELPTTLTEIGRRTFDGCLSLENITLPSGLTTLGDGAFQSSGITSLTIPENVSSIPANMCQACAKLETIYIPKTVTTIGSNAFSATGLKTIYFAGSYDAWEKISAKVPASIPVVCYYGAEEITGDFITAQPQDQTFTQDDTTAASKPLSIIVAEQADGGTLEFHWYANTKKATQGGIKVAADKVTTNGTSSQCVVDTTAAGNYYYYCLIVKTKGETVSVKWSDFAQVAITYQDVFQGKGTEQEPYQISGQADLIKLQTMVNGGASMEGIYFKLLTDVELPAGWVPMGCLKDPTNESVAKGENLNAFSGNLDGGGHTITVPENGKPLLGYVWNASVKNLKIQGKKIDGYGLVNNYTGIDLDGFGIVIDHVTVLSGTNIAESGLLGSSKKEYMAGASAVFASTITNCIIEQGVSIGSETTDAVGSIAGRFHGTIENCVSYADVTGRNYIGGILGTRDNALGDCIVKNCKFYGTVKGQKHVGGIVGGGYGYGGTANGENDTAPNGIRVTILSCAVGDTAKVSGTENVGGILGSDPYVAQSWGAYTFVGNTFSGKITGSENVGGIIGFYDSLNKFDNIAVNFYTKDCGAADGIGMVKYVDTNNQKPTTKEGTIYFNTEKGISECPEVKGCNWKAAHHRTDDPLGADKENLTKAVDTIPTEAFCYELVLKSGNVKTEYYLGDEFSFGDAEFTAKMTDGTEKDVDTKDISVSGYKKNSHSVQTVTLSYGYAKKEIQIAVLKKPSSEAEKNEIKVSFTLLGDDKHAESETAHTLSGKNLKTWVTKETYSLSLNATAGDLFKEAMKKNNLKWTGTDANKYNTLYVESVQIPGTTDYLGEFDNGPNSGWMYTINGTHPEVGIDAKFLNDGDVMVFHYTDDYTKEEGSDKWSGGAAAPAEDVKDVTTDTKTGTTTAPTEVKVSEKTATDGTKTKVAEVKVSADNQKEVLKQAKASKSKEIILNVSKSSVGDATKADVTLDKSFIDSILKDTDANLTIKTPFGDKTYTQEELKAMSAAVTGSTVTVAIEKAAQQPTDDNAANAEKIAKAKSIVKNLKLTARSSKTAKKNIKAVLKSDAKVNASIKELKDLGFTVKYRFYRSTKKAASYKSTVTKKAAAYTNTSGKKGTKYFYKVQVRAYDENGKLVATTALKQCKYASRTWSKVK